MCWRVVATWSDNPPASLGRVSCREMLDGVQTDGLSVLSSVGFGKQRLLKWPCTVVAWGESGGGGHGWSAIGRRSGGGPLSHQSSTERCASNARCLGLARSVHVVLVALTRLRLPPACVRRLDSLPSCRVLGPSSSVRYRYGNKVNDSATTTPCFRI